MTFLPIVERELRLAARKWASFWIRMAAALVTCFIGGAFLLFTSFGVVPPNSVGSGLFSLLTWLAFIVACVAGIFFTSDSISEEKREGTLGLLFLTDLRGHDVVLGKLVSNSLRSAYGLLATFPIVALALIMGGVTGGQFWRTVLALLLTLGFSLTMGMCLSSLTTDGRKSLGGTLLVVLLACIGAPVADQVWAVIETRGFQPFLSWASPGFLFVHAETGRAEFWTAAATCAGLSLVALGVACWFTPRGWQEARRETHSGGKGWLYSLKYGSEQLRERRRQKLLPLNPVLWFCGRLRWRGGAVSVALVAALLVMVALLSDRDWQEAAIGVGLGVSLLLAWVMYFWMASESARFFVESRRNGALELLLSTPLKGRDIVAGLRGALWRLFLLPVLLLAALQMTGVLAMLLKMRSVRQEELAFALVGVPFFGIGGGLFNIITRLVDLLALGWVGVWMGLTARNANLAVLKTLLFVQVLPWLASAFISPFMMMPMMFFAGVAGSAGQQWLLVVPMVLSELLWIGKDVIFIRWAQSRLETDLRILALPDSARVWAPPAPPPLPVAPTGTARAEP
jgi:ABC-type transport system involved in multi-copper enzyme maturation permease subunit